MEVRYTVAHSVISVDNMVEFARAYRNEAEFQEDNGASLPVEIPLGTVLGMMMDTGIIKEYKVTKEASNE